MCVYIYIYVGVLYAIKQYTLGHVTVKNNLGCQDSVFRSSLRQITVYLVYSGAFAIERCR